MTQHLNEHEAQIDALGPPSETALRILQLCADIETPVSRMVNVLSADQSFFSQVLRIANSSYFNYPKVVHNIDRAIIVMGFSNLKEVALSIAFRPFFLEENPNVKFNFQSLWNHATLSAIVAKNLAEKYDPEYADMYYVAGLVHDIGKLAASRNIPRDFYFLVEKAGKSRQRFHQAEREYLNFHHGDIGSKVLDRWQLPPALINMVRYHHYPEEFSGDTEDGRKVHLMFLSNLLAHFIHHELDNLDELIAMDPKLEDYFTLNSAEFKELIQEVSRTAEKRHSFLGIHQL